MDAQLSAKRLLVSDQLDVANAHLETLKSKYFLVDVHSRRMCDFVSDRFTDLKQSLDLKEREIVSRIQADSSRTKEELNAAKKYAQFIVDKSQQALECAEGVPDGDVHCTGMSSNHHLGECLIELLLLSRKDLHCCEKFLQSKMEFDVSHLQSLIELLEPDYVFAEELCSEAEANEVITCQQYDQQCPESSDNICNDSSFPTVEISKKEELNSSLKKCVDVGNEDPVKIATAIEESVNTSKLDDHCTEVQIPFLRYSEGMHLTAYICSVSCPSAFIAQPYGSQLVNFMHELSEFYENDDGYYFYILSPPKVGDVCCARFSEDGYWYRAEIVAVEGSMPDGNLSLVVEYVDYGNHESLPLHQIRVLDQRFSLFPRQALQCTLAGIELTPLCCSSGDGFHNSEWCLQVLAWIKSLIFEKPVDLIVYRFLEGNQVEVDVCVPLQAILSSESLSALPSSISADRVVTYTRNKTCSNFSLLSMMQSFKLAVPLGTADHSLTKNQQLKDCEPTLGAGEQVGLPTSASDPPSDNCSAKNSASSPDGSVQRPEALPPMLIQVEESGEFTVCVSHVITPGNFYVYPIQESCVRQMNDICNTMSNYFGEGCVQSTQTHKQPVGELCCVQSPQDGEWCRGTITNVVEKEGVKKYQVLHIDFGDLQWYMANQLKPVPEYLYQYPAQAIHCSLRDVCPCGKKQINVVSEDTDNLWNREAIERFKQLTDRPHLVAYVKVQDVGASCMLHTNLKTTVFVELIDTSGDEDVNINKEVQKCENQGCLNVKHTWSECQACTMLDSKSPSDSTDYVEYGGHIQRWNPMEADFLASKNNYAYDDEDASIAIQGYRSSRRICRFYETSKGCMKGADCQFLHLDEGVSDRQLEETFTGNTSTLCLPSVGDWIVVIVTSLISVTELFVQLPLGCTHPLQLPKDNEKCYTVREPELSELVVEMTGYYNQNVFGDRDTLQPHKGEMIAAYFAPEECWYRALVLDSTEKKIKVCYVDYGNVEWISERDVRCIKEEYMTLPFQAVHCRLAGVEKGKSYLEDAKGSLEELVIGKVLIALVVSKSCDNLLYVHLYACNDGKGIHINQVLAQKGVVSRKKCFSPVNVEPLFQPG